MKVSWKETVKPVRDKCHLAATYHCSVSFKDEGAGAVRDLLDNMAKLLDDHIERLNKELSIGLTHRAIAFMSAFVVGIACGLVLAPHVGGH